jgi:hypothetical protein
MEDKKNYLEDLKEQYLVFMSKYKLPSFEKLNSDFQIEKIAELETDFLLREMRKCIVDKFFGYLKLIETILHPVNAQMFVFSVIKSIGEKERNKLIEMYKIFSKQEIEILELDLESSDEKEAKFIIKYYEEWQRIKIDLLDILEIIKKNWDNKFETGGNSYFG